MTEEQIESTVQSWCNNLGIFEIYEELRYMPRDEQEALLTHAFNEWDHEPMLNLLKELAYHFGIYRLDKVVENWGHSTQGVADSHRWTLPNCCWQSNTTTR